MYSLLKKNQAVDQGCLVRTDTFSEHYGANLALVLTPKCDLAQEKAEFISLAGVGTSHETLEKLARKGRPEGESIPQGARVRVKGGIGNMLDGRDSRWYFLEPWDEVVDLATGGFIDYQLVLSLPAAQVLGMEVVAVIASPWSQDVAARYAAFAGRVGTPDTDSSKRRKWLDMLGKHIVK